MKQEIDHFPSSKSASSDSSMMKLLFSSSLSVSITNLVPLIEFDRKNRKRAPNMIVFIMFAKNMICKAVQSSSIHHEVKLEEIKQYYENKGDITNWFVYCVLCIRDFLVGTSFDHLRGNNYCQAHWLSIMMAINIVDILNFFHVPLFSAPCYRYLWYEANCNWVWWTVKRSVSHVPRTSRLNANNRW